MKKNTKLLSMSELLVEISVNCVPRRAITITKSFYLLAYK